VFAQFSAQAQQFGLSLDPVNAALAQVTDRLQTSFRKGLETAYNTPPEDQGIIQQAQAAYQQFLAVYNQASAVGLRSDPTVIQQNTAIYRAALGSIFDALSPDQLRAVQASFGGIDEDLQQMTDSLISAGGGATYLAQAAKALA